MISSSPMLRQISPTLRSHCCSGEKPPQVETVPVKRVGISL